MYSFEINWYQSCNAYLSLSRSVSVSLSLLTCWLCLSSIPFCCCSTFLKQPNEKLQQLQRFFFCFTPVWEECSLTRRDTAPKCTTSPIKITRTQILVHTYMHKNTNKSTPHMQANNMQALYCKKQTHRVQLGAGCRNPPCASPPVPAKDTNVRGSIAWTCIVVY